MIGPDAENVAVTMPPTCSTPGCAVKSVTDVRPGVETGVGVGAGVDCGVGKGVGVGRGVGVDWGVGVGIGTELSSAGPPPT